jgi:tRNA dimethylallyltransferase
MNTTNTTTAHIPHTTVLRPFSEKPVLVLAGATASGKTALSLALAENLPIIFPEFAPAWKGVEIISADSRQMYRYLDIGTAKPLPEELQGVPHHFIDVKNPDELYSAGQFGVDAARTIDDIHARGNLAVVVGGSGLYIKALCDGLFEEDGQLDTTTARATVERRLAECGLAALYKELQEVDVVSAEKYNDLNPRRLVRALEYYYTTGIPLSQAQEQFSCTRTFQARYIGVFVERSELYEHINKRTEQMFMRPHRTIIEETQDVLRLGFESGANALNTVGYKECLGYLRGEYSRERALELAQQHTRHYAKRQMTWFRREHRIQWLAGSTQELAAYIVSDLKKHFAE